MGQDDAGAEHDVKESAVGSDGVLRPGEEGRSMIARLRVVSDETLKREVSEHLSAQNSNEELMRELAAEAEEGLAGQIDEEGSLDLDVDFSGIPMNSPKKKLSKTPTRGGGGERHVATEIHLVFVIFFT